MRKAPSIFLALLLFATQLFAQDDVMLFAENKGQWNDNVKYCADLNMGKVYLESNKIDFLIHDFDHFKHAHDVNDKKDLVNCHFFKIAFTGANATSIVAENKVEPYRNYFIGNDPKHWASNVGLFQKSTFKQLYPGIDLEVTGDGSGMKYEFQVKAGADPSQIRQTYEGIEKITIEKNEVHYHTAITEIIEKDLQAYQIINGSKLLVKCRFKKVGANALAYEFPNGYNTQYDLVIDPTVIFGTYTGSTADNWGYTATYDNTGCMYIGGYVNATPPQGSITNPAYPTSPGAFQATFGGGTGGNTGGGNGIEFACDMGITKFSADGKTLLYSTYIGGSDNETPHSLVVDAQGNLIIYGVAYSANYPISSNAYDKTWNGDADIVVTKLNSGGTALIGSTYIGGSIRDGINFDPTEFGFGNLKFNYGDQNRGEVNIDGANNIYVASCTNSSNFPVTPSAYQSASGGAQDGCAFKLNSDCSQLLWSTYLGGTGDDACYALDITSIGDVYACGGTMSSNFPITGGTIHTFYQGGQFDGFIARIGNNGTQLVNSTYIGTSGHDQVYFVKVDGEGNVYFVGQTTGAYPVQSALYSNPNSGQFVSKLKGSLDSIYYSTVFGTGNSRPNISPTAFLVDTCKNIYVTGWGALSGTFGNFSTVMAGLPLTNDAQQKTTDGTDFYNIVLGKDASSLLYASYFGGNGGIEHVDGGTNRFDSRGIIYEAICAGCGQNSLTPSTPGVWSPSNQSFNCNLFGLKMEFNLGRTEVKINASPRATGCVPLTVQFNSVLYNVANVTWDFRDGSPTTNFPNPVHTFTDTGHYNVMLIGQDPKSCNLLDTAYVDVWVRDDSLVANYLPFATIDCYNKNLNISSFSYATTNYSWDFGDGTQATTSSVNHNYLNSGSYNVTLILSDTSKCNLKDTFNTRIVIPPLVDLKIVPNDTQGCVPLTVQFNNLTSYTAGDYKWYFGDGDSSSLAQPTHTFTTKGTYPVVVYWNDTNTCNKRDTAVFSVVTIDSSADASFILQRQFYGCDSVKITVYSSYTGEDNEFWDFGDGYTTTDNPATHTFIAPAFDTLRHFLYDAKMICKPIDTDYVIISLSPLATDYSIPDTLGCMPFTADFTGVSDLPTTKYFWFFGDGDSSSGGHIQHTYPQKGTYTVLQVAIDSNSCVNIDSNYATIVVIDDSVNAIFSVNTLNACDSDLHIQIVDQSINAVTYYWQFGDGDTSHLPNPDHHYYLPGTYPITLIVTDTSRCHPIDSITHYVTLKPNAVAQFELMNVCDGYPVIFANGSIVNPESVWDFGDGQTSVLNNPTHTYTTSGDYNVTLFIKDTSSCNVYDTIQKTVTVYATPIAKFYLEKDTYKFETPVLFTNQSTNADQFHWTFGDGDTSSEFSPTHYYDHTFGWHQACLQAYYEGAPCQDTVCDSLYILFTPLIGVPNAFTPNGDGINDFVRVEGKGIIELEFRIFNRWGLEVYYGTDPKKGWDGTFKGVPQEMEVYTYLVIARFINKEPVQLKGNITLLR